MQIFCPATLIKTPNQVFSCEYCEIFKNTYVEEYLRTAASGISWNAGMKNTFTLTRCYLLKVPLELSRNIEKLNRKRCRKIQGILRAVASRPVFTFSKSAMETKCEISSKLTYYSVASVFTFEQLNAGWVILERPNSCDPK